LSVAFEDDTLAQYQVRYDSTTHGIAGLTDARLFETGHASTQPFLWDVGDVDWHRVQRLRPYRARTKRDGSGVQERLFP
jgi:hypothetical protein